MPRHPFIKASFPDPDLTPRKIAKRLMLRLTWIRVDRAAVDPDEQDEEKLYDLACLGRLDGVCLTPEDHTRVDRRAARLHERKLRLSGIGHLERSDRDKLSVLKGGVALAAITDEHQADSLAATLHAEMPWMSAATEYAWHAMRRSVREGHVGFRLPPVILDGPPGIGKTRWARRLGDLIGTTSTIIDATTEAASFAVVGCQRGWSGARPSRVLEHILTDLVGNPFIIIDELDKAGRTRSDRGQSYGLAEGLLPLLEPGTAHDWTCPYYRVRFDMSCLSWVLLTNSLTPVPEPLLSRCTVLKMNELNLADLLGFAEREGLARGFSEASVHAITAALAAVAPQAAMRPSLRTVLRMLDRAADLENKPMVI